MDTAIEPSSHEPNDAAQVLAELLNRDRDKFNARFLIARSRWRALSPGEWKAVLAESVAPVVFAAEQALPERAEAVAEAAYEGALELLARDYLGPRAPSEAMEVLWRDILPRVVSVIALAPRRVLPRACNALLGLRAHGLEAVWARRLRALALSGAFDQSDAEQFEHALLVLAWRCGLAHARRAAFKYLREMPFELARAVVGAPQAEPAAWASLLARLEREPFFNPSQAPSQASDASSKGLGGRLKIVAQVGEWEAWGGGMASPPHVARRRGALWAWSGRAWWRLHADAFGATLLPARFEVPPDKLPPELAHDESRGGWKLQVQNASAAGGGAGGDEALQVTHGPNAAYAQAESALLRGFDGVLSAASDDHVLAFTTRLSMRIFVVARG